MRDRHVMTRINIHNVKSRLFCPTCRHPVPTTKFFNVGLVHRAGLTGLDHINADVRGRN